ncbi:phytosulfokine receptor 1-like isoform X1 [Durio zibethinus]|uniref:Phytosulfokine receptor 1-like isoform X1 n=1 Tax=Durio zibethinus TaxID=66656 RepID=A0A6P5YVU7_DURZI|nr:phytosulfokine receptor 1-like isoform X1 [Durio zibethinus]
MSFPNFYLVVILLVFRYHSWILRSQELTCNLNDLIALNGFSSCLESDILGWNNSTSDCCTWTGVTCDNSIALSKRVVSLELGSKKLSGTICDSLAGLHQLRILNLSHNLLRGSLPTKLFRMQNLEVLDISDNSLVGRIPEEIHLSSIRYVNISKNSIFGPMDENLCKTSPHIQYLDLSVNNFFGEVSPALGNCASLQYLILKGNNFRSLPKGIFRLPNLRVLHLQNNSFSGPLSYGIGDLSNLVELDISSNSFTGVLPDVFGNLGKLQLFSASSNNFIGFLPISMLNSPSLTKLDLHNNTLNGPINLNCSAMTHLNSLHLGSNNFHGSIPHSMSSCKSLSMLNLGHNNLRGQVPYNFKNLQALSVLALSRTNLVNLSSTLKILQYCKNLTVLILSENFREEQIPSDVNLQFGSLKVLSIAYCELRGSIPLWLLGCNRLQFLDLSRNQLSGAIPSWFNMFKYLFYVDLSNNSFTGGIPKGLTELQALIDMNISLEGPPVGFPLFRTGIGGATFLYKNIWSFPPTLDLSYNMLSGPILPTFGNLVRLHVLNLNENHLSGSIPESLSGMRNLEILDLSNNKLSGKIPNSLVQLSFLSKFSVAYNELYGEIPVGGQFMTFPYSSFEGNDGLCGGIYSQCPHEHTPIESPGEPMTVVGSQFGYGVATGFVLTITICFVSGWILPREAPFEQGSIQDTLLAARGKSSHHG